MYFRNSIYCCVLVITILVVNVQSFLIVSSNAKSTMPGSMLQKSSLNTNGSKIGLKRESRVKRYGFFDNLKGAFANEKYDNKPNAGLKNGPEMMNVTFMPSYAEIQAVPGQPIKDVAQKAKAKIKYSCKKGECGTCEVSCNGNRVKACQAVIPLVRPSRQVTIKVLNP